jgi:hypothetical protein
LTDPLVHDPEIARQAQRFVRWSAVAVFAVLGVAAVMVTPAADWKSRGVWISVGSVVVAYGVGECVDRWLRFKYPDVVAHGVGFWVGAMCGYPALRYIHDASDWALSPGSGDYTFARHAGAISIATVLLVLGRSLPQR